MKKGFGILEVLVAAVVLGFMIIGLNTLQKGNRESILRVRARDAANFVAQHVLDSLGTLGANSLQVPATPPPGCNANLVYCNDKYIYNFEGKPQLDKNTKAITTQIEYFVQVELLGIAGSSKDTTYFTRSNSDPNLNEYSKKLEATVSWKFKNSEQSIKMAKVVR